MKLLDIVLPAMAQQQPAGGEGASPQGSLIASFIPLLLMIAVFYVLLIRPQQKRQKEHGHMLKNLKKGDRVVTTGGMIGTIVGVAEDKVVLKVGEDGVKLEFERSAVSHLAK